MGALFQSSIGSLPLLGRGKVRDLYAVGDQHLLMLASDRLSAFDVVLPEPIAEKGVILTRVTQYWMERLAHVVPNQLTGIDPESVVQPHEAIQVRGRAMVVKRLKPVPIEAVVRGYLIGSGWKEYQATGEVCGIALPKGLRMAERLPEPIFTPAHKAEVGAHDENISFAQAAALIGAPLAEEIRRISIQLYTEAAREAAARGLIIADTKFEFGLDDRGVLHLMDEVLTPDSSRYWPADQWQPGSNPPSFDKQPIRDYLETLDWNKQAPGPALPEQVRHETAARYREALWRIAGQRMPRVGLVMGSASDLPTLQPAVDLLNQFGIPHEVQVVSAHRMPDTLFTYAQTAAERGLAAIIAGAGGAAHLPGMLAAKTTVPVLGVPIPSKYLRGEDSLLSIVQMPKGIPVATFAIGEAGAANAALFAIALLAGHTAPEPLADAQRTAQALSAFRRQQTQAAEAMNRGLVPPQA